MKEKENWLLLGNESEGSAELQTVSNKQEQREAGAGQVGTDQSSTNGRDKEH